MNQKSHFGNFQVGVAGIKPEMYEWLFIEASAHECTVSQLIRRIIADKMKEKAAVAAPTDTAAR
jgi:hypothetical protein